jgi:arylsulfatase A-like enzyme
MTRCPSALAVVACLLTMLVWVGGCRSEHAGPYNVLLVTIDTLRADRLHHLGYPRPTSPALDALASEGAVFPRSYSVSGWTLPSVASLMTGRYPKDHAATDFRFPIDPSVMTLPEILQASGYSTQAIVSHFMLNPTNGFARGFDVFDASVLEQGNPHDATTAREVTDLALAGMRAADAPWFIWAHYFDPHFVYHSQPGFGVFGSAELDLYDQEIGFTDQQIGRLLDEVEADRTIVIFTADHGEEFGEHGGVYHYTLYDEVMRTPLVVRAPFLEPGIRDGLAEQIDLLPTLLGMLGIERDPMLPGRDLFDPQASDGPAFFERDRPPPWRQRGVAVDDHVLWVIVEVDMEEIPEDNRRTAVPVKNVEPGIYMYDLASDPKQTINLYYPSDARSRELLALVEAHFSTERSPATRIELDEQTRQQLRDLGYAE